MTQPTQKPYAFRIKRPELRARFEAFMAESNINANQAANRLIEDGLDSIDSGTAYRRVVAKNASGNRISGSAVEASLDQAMRRIPTSGFVGFDGQGNPIPRRGAYQKGQKK